jgi:hypothetical protein
MKDVMGMIQYISIKGKSQNGTATLKLPLATPPNSQHWDFLTLLV